MRRRSQNQITIQTTDENVGHSQTYIFAKGQDNANKTICVDFGMKPRVPTETLEHNQMINASVPTEAQNIKALVLTHCHTDHIGLLPSLVSLGFRGPVYCSFGTANIIGPILRDCCKMMQMEKMDLYTADDVELALSLIKPIPFDVTQVLYDDNELSIKLTLLGNNHIPGAAAALLQYDRTNAEQVNVLFTGDIKIKSEIFNAPEFPQWVLDLPVTIVTESTYGNTFEKPESGKFEEAVSQIYNRGGNVVIATIANERPEVLIHHLLLMKKNRQIPSDTIIYVRGRLMQQLYNIYKNRRDTFYIPKDYSFESKDVVFLDAGQDPPENHHIILVTPGMVQGGESKRLALLEAHNPNSGLVITSYVPPKGIADVFLNTPKGEVISLKDGTSVKKQFDVIQCREFSGHAIAPEILNYILRFKNRKGVIINHGDPEVQNDFKLYIENNGVEVPVHVATREICFKLNHHGIYKILNSKMDYRTKETFKTLDPRKNGRRKNPSSQNGRLVKRNYHKH